jgi:hypothetical protein
LPVLKSKPSIWLVVGSVVAGIGAIAIVYSAVGALLFEFVRMPFSVLGLIAGILVAYFVTAETAKRYFFRKFEI